MLPPLLTSACTLPENGRGQTAWAHLSERRGMHQQGHTRRQYGSEHALVARNISLGRSTFRPLVPSSAYYAC